jgi:two-component system chemotaxis response regulator CheY
MRLTLGNILRKMGHEVIEAENGKDALLKYRENQPDLVTLDITMPEMDGVEAVKRLREIDPNAKIVMVSAMGQKDFVMETVKNGASDFIVKPFQEERVRATVQKFAKGAREIASRIYQFVH